MSALEPPDAITLTLEEAEALLKALEDAKAFLHRLVEREPLTVMDTIAPLLLIEDQEAVLRRKLGLDPGEANER